MNQSIIGKNIVIGAMNSVFMPRCDVQVTSDFIQVTIKHVLLADDGVISTTDKVGFGRRRGRKRFGSGGVRRRKGWKQRRRDWGWG